MRVRFYLMQYELRVLSEANLRALLANGLFNGEVGRQYWASTGCTFEVMKGRRVKRFFRTPSPRPQAAPAPQGRGGLVVSLRPSPRWVASERDVGRRLPA